MNRIDFLHIEGWKIEAKSRNIFANLTASEDARNFPASNKNVDNAQSGLSSFLSTSVAERPVTKDCRKNLHSERSSSTGTSLRSSRFADVQMKLS